MDKMDRMAINDMGDQFIVKHLPAQRGFKNISNRLNDGKVINMNPVAQIITGWNSNDAKGKPISSIFIIQDALTGKPIKNPIEKVINTGKTVHLSNYTTLISKQGNDYHISDSAAPILNNEGDVEGMVLVFRDVGEQYRHRESENRSRIALQNKEKELRETLNSMVDSVISIDETGKILGFNCQSERLFGYKIEEVVGKDIKMLMPEANSKNHSTYVSRYLKTGKANIIGIGRDLFGLRRNRQTFPMRLSVAELPLDDTGIRRFIGTCQDLTLTKQQEEMLRRSQKMDALGKLTGGIAHDFNNILGVVNGYSDLLEEMLEEGTKTKEYTKQIHIAGQRGAKLTKKLLSFSRKETPDAEKIYINTLLQQQRDMQQKTITVRIKLVLDLCDNIWPTWLDGSDLEDAILNMCINAMHAMTGLPSGAQLSISTRNQSLSYQDAISYDLDAGNYVQLTITDNGTGMEASIKDKIFDPFFSTKGNKGTELGLSQVIGFVERTGGAVRVYSDPGHGSRFSLFFPKYNSSESIDESIGQE